VVSERVIDQVQTTNQTQTTHSDTAQPGLAHIRTAAMLFVVTVVFVLTFAPAFLMSLNLVDYSRLVSVACRLRRKTLLIYWPTASQSTGLLHLLLQQCRQPGHLLVHEQIFPPRTRSNVLSLGSWRSLTVNLATLQPTHCEPFSRYFTPNRIHEMRTFPIDGSGVCQSVSLFVK